MQDIDEESNYCVKIELGEGEEPLKFSSPMDVFARFWPLLLWAAASSGEVLLLLMMVVLLFLLLLLMSLFADVILL